ncbi:hypothetical protein Marme_3728 [Marinomonas mediterranea MMB-1]|uniref:Uncharacterized protein n=1 Tax=Marinomonas mediterranea (strain ATCC 700492 / JCM 21426 / NBRC 103028 / MMB-1) TaxID=717774 RepID=F2JW50_MARM1|nr:hypothetical protein Marme_3728 [Marinomonas mediterranea MMB-1]
MRASLLEALMKVKLENDRKKFYENQKIGVMSSTFLGGLHSLQTLLEVPQAGFL